MSSSPEEFSSPEEGGWTFSPSLFFFMVQPIETWTFFQAFIFPWLFIIPAEMHGGASSALIHFLGHKESDLPYGRTTFKPLNIREYMYIYFNRLAVLPFISYLVVRMVWNSKVSLERFGANVGYFPGSGHPPTRGTEAQRKNEGS